MTFRRLEILLVVAGAIAFALAFQTAPTYAECAAAGDVVSSHWFVTSGWVGGLAGLSASMVAFVRRDGALERIGSGLFYLLPTLVVVIILVYKDSPCPFLN